MENKGFDIAPHDPDRNITAGIIDSWVCGQEERISEKH